MGSCSRLEKTGDEAISAAEERSSGKAGNEHHDRRQPGEEARDQRRAEASDLELPGRSEVEESRVEADREREAHEDERRRDEQGLSERPDGTGDVGGVPALDRRQDAGRVADRAGEDRAVADDDFAQRTPERTGRIAPETPEVLEVGQNDEDGAHDEGRQKGEARKDGAA